MIERNLRAPRAMNECKFNPSDAMVHKFPSSGSRNSQLDRWIMALGLAAMLGGLLMLSGCGGMTNDQVIAEVKKCHAAGMDARAYSNIVTEPEASHVVCRPKVEK